MCVCVCVYMCVCIDIDMYIHTHSLTLTIYNAILVDLFTCTQVFMFFYLVCLQSLSRLVLYCFSMILSIYIICVNYNKDFLE